MRLDSLVPATTTVVSRVFSVGGRGRDLFDAAERLDIEGIVAKRIADAYRPGTVWYNIKSRAYTSRRRTLGAVPEEASLTSVLDTLGSAL